MGAATQCNASIATEIALLDKAYLCYVAGSNPVMGISGWHIVVRTRAEASACLVQPWRS
jgi:hypothetical protein